jgi:hypothetical protein
MLSSAKDVCGSCNRVSGAIEEGICRLEKEGRAVCAAMLPADIVTGSLEKWLSHHGPEQKNQRNPYGQRQRSGYGQAALGTAALLLAVQLLFRLDDGEFHQALQFTFILPGFHHLTSQ